MPHRIVNFTRGSQLIGHFGFMFAAGLKGPLIVAALTFIGLIWWRASATLTDNEAYLCWMRAYAAIYSWFEFDPTKQANLETASGGHVSVPLSSLAGHPLIAAAWTKYLAAVRSGAALAAMLTIPATIAFAWVAAWFGRRSKQSRHERGATLTDLPQLVAEIDAHNRVERAREYRIALGAGWRLASPSERRAAGLYEPYMLAGATFPWRLEQSHAMLIGTTGTGKTVAMRELLAQVRARGTRAVVFDLTGAFIEAFYDPNRDVILNPLDARCPQWSVFEDCTDEASLTAAAEALVPHDGGGAEQFWVLAARMLFVEMCLKLIAEGRGTNAALSAELMTASLAHVHGLMKGTVADPLTAPEAARMAESIRAVFNANAKALKMLPQAGEPFSVRRWILGDSALGGFLFVSARYVDMAVASRLLTVWMDTAMNTLMSGPRTPDLKLWFLFDELGALHRLPAIEKGLQTVRNYGGAIVAGVHAYAKLKETYGENMAMTLAALARTKLVLATADRESATWCSDFIGHRQYREMEEGYSYGYNNARDAVSLTPRRQIEPLLLPDQLMNLPRLQGYVKFPDGFPAAPVRLNYIDYPVCAEAFVPRPAAPKAAVAHAGNNPRAKAADDPPTANSSDQGPAPADDSKGSRSDARDDVGSLFDYANRRAGENAPQLPTTAEPVELATGLRADNAVPQGGAISSILLARNVTRTPGKPDTEAAHSSLEPPERSLTNPYAPLLGAPEEVDPTRGFKPFSHGDNISLRELKAGIAPGSPTAADQFDLEP